MICRLVYPEEQRGGRNIASDHELFCLVTVEGLVQVDLKARTVKVIRRDADLISVVTSQYENKTLLARTPNRVLTLDRDGKEVGVYSLPTELRNADLEWWQLGSDNALVQAGRNGNDLFWLDAAGKIARHERVELHAVSRQPNIVSYMVDLLGVPSPAVIVAFLANNPWGSLRSRKEALGYFVVLGRALSLRIVAFVGIIAAIAGGMAALYFREYWYILLAAFVGWQSFHGYRVARFLAAQEQWERTP